MDKAVFITVKVAFLFISGIILGEAFDYTFSSK